MVRIHRRRLADGLVEPYATSENLLGVALSPLQIAGSGENDYRRFLLAECLEAYAELDESQAERLRGLLHAEAYSEVEPLMKTTYERGIEDGIERGIEQGERRSALRQMEAKFGPLPPDVKQRIEALSSDALARLLLDLLKAESLKDLGLID